jgi:hypothetical protein
VAMVLLSYADDGAVEATWAVLHDVDAESC